MTSLAASAGLRLALGKLTPCSCHPIREEPQDLRFPCRSIQKAELAGFQKLQLKIIPFTTIHRCASTHRVNHPPGQDNTTKPCEIPSIAPIAPIVSWTTETRRQRSPALRETTPQPPQPWRATTTTTPSSKSSKTPSMTKLATMAPRSVSSPKRTSSTLALYQTPTSCSSSR